MQKLVSLERDTFSVEISKKDLHDGPIRFNWVIFLRVLIIHLSIFLVLGPQITGLIVASLYGKTYVYNLKLHNDKCDIEVIIQTLCWIFFIGPVILISIGKTQNFDIA